jgi:hypothetical protein
MSESILTTANREEYVSSEALVGYIQGITYRANYFLSIGKIFGYSDTLSFARFRAEMDVCINELGHALMASKLHHITWLQEDGQSKQGKLLGVAFNLEDESSDFDLRFLVSDSISDNTPSGTITPHQIIQFDQPPSEPSYHQPHLHLRRQAGHPMGPSPLTVQ